MPKFAVLMPTTGDRAAHAELAVTSALLQEQGDFALHVIGEGLTVDSAARLQTLVATDRRLHLHIYAKDARRGERYRHAVLQQIDAAYVAYLLDRDLWFPDHLSHLEQALADVDFAHTGLLNVLVDGQITPGVRIDLRQDWQRSVVVTRDSPLAMSCVGHRLASYRALPFGWRTTPAGIKTDRYMWAQFLAQPWCRARSLSAATVLYFQSEARRAWSSAQRRTELEPFLRQLRQDGGTNLRIKARELHEDWRYRQQRWVYDFFWWHPRLRHLRNRLWDKLRGRP